ncbi:MAG: creatininase family protein [Myxococcales bacterium]|nr:creatininase family protein [Myxococcales bacterium]
MPLLELSKISYTQISALDRTKTVVMAVFSPLEVHGPHLPLGEDIFTAEALGRGAAERYLKSHPDWNFLLLPPYAVATDTVPKLGSVPFPPALVRDVAYHSLLPFTRLGFKRLGYSSFHGGPRHFMALEDAAAQLSNPKEDIAAISLFSAAIARLAEGKVFHDAVRDDPRIEITLANLKEDHHAGFVETSLAMHLWPECVDDGWQNLPPSVSRPVEEDSKLNDTYLYGYEEKAGLLEKSRRTLGVAQSIYRAMRHFQDNTYHGYPGKASAEAGRRLYNALVETSADLLTEFIEKGTAMDGHSPLWKLRPLLLNETIGKAFDSWVNPQKP